MLEQYTLESAIQKCALGFALLRCNYRGSTGAGDQNVRSLIGHVGNYDVADCYLAHTTLLERGSTSHVLLYGGIRKQRFYLEF